MISARLDRWRRFLEALFPERHIYIRASGETHGLVLTTARQTAIAGGVSAVLLWTLIATVMMAFTWVAGGPAGHATQRTKAYYERLMADRQARLNSAVAQLSDTSGSFQQLALATEKRHAALALLFQQINGQPGAAQAIAPAPLKLLANNNPTAGLRAVSADQDRLITDAETFAHSKADRLRLAFRLAGLDPDAFNHADPNSLGGPLIDTKDPRALAAVLEHEGRAVETFASCEAFLAAAPVETMPSPRRGKRRKKS